MTMLTADWFKDKRVTMMGLGTLGGGVGMAKWLLRRGARITVTDLRDQHALAPSLAELERAYITERRRRGKENVHRIEYVLGRHEDRLFTRADMVIRNPAVPREHPLLALAEKSGVPVEADISVFFMLCPFPITAVTGTKGKTTVTTLLAAICKAADPRTVVGGNIRISPLDALDRMIALSKKRRHRPMPVVLELSSWQLEGLEKHALSPHVAVVTNVLEDHLNRYRDMDDYARAKEIAVAFQKEGDVAILNADNARTAAMGRKRGLIRRAPHGGRRFWFSVGRPAGRDGCFIERGRIVIRDGGKTVPVMPFSSVKLPGEHNKGNVLAAVAAAYASGIRPAVIRRAVGAFEGVPGRLERVAVKRGAAFVNDTTATTPDAAIAAMNTLGGKGGRIILLAGGADKELRFGEWAKAVKRHAKHLVLFDGTATPKMEAALAAERVNVPTAGARSMREAIDEALRHVRRGDVVLLSPGCASFGLFKNEFDRGDQFVALVRKLR